MAIIHWWSRIGRFSQICLLKQIWSIVLLYFWLLAKTKLKNLVILKFKSNSFHIFGYLISLHGKISAVKNMAAHYIWLCLLGRDKGFMWFQVFVLEVSDTRFNFWGLYEALCTYKVLLLVLAHLGWVPTFSGKNPWFQF
jgi:hypothetical protein